MTFALAKEGCTDLGDLCVGSPALSVEVIVYRL